MRTLPHLALVASLAGLATNASAQSELGESCGCPPLASRSTVNLSSLATGGNLTSNSTTLTCNNTYILDILLYVNDGQDLYIEPGTVIKAAAGTGANAKSLVVARGGQTWANGSAACPIIFTAQADPLDGTFPVGTRGQWGGLLLLGKAKNNLLLANSGALAISDGVGTIEGLVAGDTRNYYGAAPGAEVNNDNSGIVRYVSLRHGGAIIGAANEINGLTLGSVGNGTTLDHIEVVANADDCFEFFGGTVDAKYLTGAYCDDDCIDWDHGYTGRLQFIFTLQVGVGDNGIEADNDDASSNNTPFADPIVFNMTHVGRANTGDQGIEAKERTRGYIANSIFTNIGSLVNLANTRVPTDAYQEWQGGNLEFRNCSADGVTNILRVNGSVASAGDVTTFNGQGNVLTPGIIDYNFSINTTTNVVSGGFNPVPSAANAATNLVPPVDGFFEGAAYRGAFRPGQTPWTDGWTLTDRLGLDNSSRPCPADINKDGVINVSDFLALNSAFGTSCGL